MSLKYITLSQYQNALLLKNHLIESAEEEIKEKYNINTIDLEECNFDDLYFYYVLRDEVREKIEEKIEEEIKLMRESEYSEEEIEEIVDVLKP